MRSDKNGPAFRTGCCPMLWKVVERSGCLEIAEKSLAVTELCTFAAHLDFPVPASRSPELTLALVGRSLHFQVTRRYTFIWTSLVPTTLSSCFVALSGVGIVYTWHKAATDNLVARWCGSSACRTNHLKAWPYHDFNFQGGTSVAGPAPRRSRGILREKCHTSHGTKMARSKKNGGKTRRCFSPRPRHCVWRWFKEREVV